MRRAFFCALGFCLSLLGRAQCVNIEGVVTDAYTGKPVSGVLINQKMKSESQILSNTFATGQYRVSLPCDAVRFSAEAKGYRPLSFSVHTLGHTTGAVFHVPIKLVQIDKQTSDQPYFQEQQQFVSLDSSRGKVAQSATRLFEVTDALSGKPVQAELCLFYTKTTRKDCQQLSSRQPGYEVSFTSTDIIAIEVKAKGYQPYFGNLIMDQLDNKKSKYQIRLSAQPDILSVTVNVGGLKVNCTRSGTKPIPMFSTDGIHFSCELPAAGNYLLTVSNAGGVMLHSRDIQARNGINLYAANLHPSAGIPTKSGTSTKLTVDARENKPRIIYFDRSDYRLRDESKTVLDTLAKWLYINPAGYLTIIGHTDNVGNSKLNQTLSEYRARLVYHFLEEQGADVSRITYIGRGDSSPAAPNDVETNKMKNRRVEIQLLTKP